VPAQPACLTPLGGTMIGVELFSWYALLNGSDQRRRGLTESDVFTESRLFALAMTRVALS
jgi:hypothetical protein